MPEGDTINRAATALRAALLGKPTTSFEARRHSGIVPVTGAMIERVESFGKHLEIGWDDGVVLHTHMRMTGSWHLYRPGERWRKSARQMRVFIEVPGWQAICFSAPVVETYRARIQCPPGPRIARSRSDQTDVDASRASSHGATATSRYDGRCLARSARGVRRGQQKVRGLWACGCILPLVAASTTNAPQPHRHRPTLVADQHRASTITMPGVPGSLRSTVASGSRASVQRAGESIVTASRRVTYWCPQCQLAVAPELSIAPGQVAEGLVETRAGGR